MISKISLTLAVLGLTYSVSGFAGSLPVPPTAGGDGIQSALDSLSAGGEVVLSKGTYIVRHPIILFKDHQTLRGAGASTILYLADGANCPVVVLGLLADNTQPVKDVRVSSLYIDGNRTNQQKEVWRVLSDGAGVYNNGVDVWNVDGATVDNVTCCRCRSGGMVTSGRTRRLTVQGYTAFDNQFDGLACYFTEDSDFSHLDLHDNLSAGISLDLNFNHNVIHDSVLSGNDLGIFMRQSRNNTFNGLTIQKSRHHGVFMAQTFVGTSTGLRPCPGSECVGNTFDNLMVAHCGGKGFLVNDITCTNNVICGGQFADDKLGDLGQAAPNLVTMRMLADHNDQPAASSVAPTGHKLPTSIALIQATPKPL